MDVRHHRARAAWQLPGGGESDRHVRQQGDAVGAAGHHPLPLALVALLVGASSAQAATTTRIDCGQKKVTVFFWPHGHGEIPSLGFPQFSLPHLDVYKSASTFPAQDELAVVLSDGGTAAAPGCAPAGARKATRFAGRPRKTTKQAAIRCSARKRAKLELVADPGRSGTLRIWYGRVLGVVAKVAPSGSTLSFDRGYCSPY